MHVGNALSSCLSDFTLLPSHTVRTSVSCISLPPAVLVSPVYGSLEVIPTAMSFQGMTEKYFVAGASASNQAGVPFDLSVRSISKASSQSIVFTSFKQSTGVSRRCRQQDGAERGGAMHRQQRCINSTYSPAC